MLVLMTHVDLSQDYELATICFEYFMCRFKLIAMKFAVSVFTDLYHLEYFKCVILI